MSYMMVCKNLGERDTQRKRYGVMSIFYIINKNYINISHLVSQSVYKIDIVEGKKMNKLTFIFYLYHSVEKSRQRFEAIVDGKD